MFDFGHVEFEIPVRYLSGGLGRVCSVMIG